MVLLYYNDNRSDLNMKENFKKLISNKFFLIALIALIIIILGIGFTYAWLTWQSEKNTKFTLSIDTYTDVLFSGNVGR